MKEKTKNDLKIEMIDINKLIPYARNPRINDAAVPKLAGLIKEFGFKVPIVIKSDYSIIDGHERYKAAKLLNLKIVPCIIADDLSETQIKAFRIAVNKSAEWAKWDEELLRLELKELKLEDFKLDSIGFEDFKLDTLDDDVNFAPGNEDTQSHLDEIKGAKKKLRFMKCPHCGEIFDVSEAQITRGLGDVSSS